MPGAHNNTKSNFTYKKNKNANLGDHKTRRGKDLFS